MRDKPTPGVRNGQIKPLTRRLLTLMQVLSLLFVAVQQAREKTISLADSPFSWPISLQFSSLTTLFCRNVQPFKLLFKLLLDRLNYFNLPSQH